MKYNLINKVLTSNNINLLPDYILRKICKKYKIYFVPTRLKHLPINNHPILSNTSDQENIIKKFNKINELISFHSCPHLLQILRLIFKEREKFDFLDFGGEYIDLYLYLKKNFKNINYYFINQEEINQNFIYLKSKYNFENFTIIKNLNELSNYNYDFINFGSVIQYIANYEDILNKIIKTSKKYIFFSATHFYDKNDNSSEKIVVKQTNLLPKKLFCHFFEFESFIRKFYDNEFKIVFKEKNKTDNVNYKNFENLLKNTTYTDLLISRS
jgi:hypothetical protein